jgi:hypothetical protein
MDRDLKRLRDRQHEFARNPLPLVRIATLELERDIFPPRIRGQTPKARMAIAWEAVDISSTFAGAHSQARKPSCCRLDPELTATSTISLR